MRFTYCSGQRPLDGYTIKRGIGRGAFGEVYLAVSDGGKEVALKQVRGNHEMEMRGMAQCLNLKHPGLVHLYDLRFDSRSDYWVVMEYVAGETLGTVLSRHPNGLPVELAREWFLTLCRAIAYLHDQGIVHRDLKPANIFLENGILKVGDYGLSKALSASHHTAQTQTVGTVHYMAPEISTGNYNKQIDIYAAGIIFHEMLTGRVPFSGESNGEILMKHLTTLPDLSKVPLDYVNIVQKALAKNPAQRYANIMEMARAIDAVGQTAKVAARLDIPVAQVARIAPVTAPLPAAPQARPDDRPGQSRTNVRRAGASLEPILEASPVLPPRGLVAELSGSLLLAIVFTALQVGLVATLYTNWVNGASVSLFFVSLLASWLILVPAKVWSSSSSVSEEKTSDFWGRRILLLLLGSLLGVVALWIDGHVLFSHGDHPQSLGDRPSLSGFVSERVLPQMAYLTYFSLGFFVLRWWKMTDRTRAGRFHLFPVMAAGFWSWLFYALVRPGQPWLGLVLVLTAVTIQLASPWQRPPVPLSRKLRLRYS